MRIGEAGKGKKAINNIWERLAQYVFYGEVVEDGGGCCDGCGRGGGAVTEPSKKPMLRIESGMHTAGIKRIGVDSAERILVTASDDKAIRVWNISSGQPLSVIRPPAGDINEGKLYAVAISSDGNVIAAGG